MSDRAAAQAQAAQWVAADAVALCAKLSAREREVLVLTSKGLMAKEVASALGLSVMTVQAYRQNIHHKLQVETAVESAVIATKAGLV